MPPKNKPIKLEQDAIFPSDQVRVIVEKIEKAHGYVVESLAHPSGEKVDKDKTLLEQKITFVFLVVNLAEGPDGQPIRCEGSKPIA